MDIGIPLSQIASQNSLTTGFPSLDSALEGGLKPGCIYEIYGPPGSCKESFLKNLFFHQPSSSDNEKSQGKHLLIETHKPIWDKQKSPYSSFSNIYTTRITKLSHLVRFLQLHHKISYSTLIIDGFAQLLIDHTNFSRRVDTSATDTTTSKNNNNNNTTHTTDYTTKRLNLLLSILTKYATANGTIVLLVNHTMVTQRESHLNPVSTNNPGINNFFVTNSLKRSVLTSALDWSNALTGKDAIGLKLIKSRLGLYWHWAEGPVHSRPKGRSLAAIVLPGSCAYELHLTRPSHYNSHYDLRHASKQTVQTDSISSLYVNKNAGTNENRDDDGTITIQDSQQ